MVLVSFFFIPFIRAQNESRREPPSGWGAFNPGFPGFAALYEARPLAFRPPLGFLPSFLVHAGDLAIEHHDGCARQRGMYISVELDAFAGEQNML